MLGGFGRPAVGWVLLLGWLGALWPLGWARGQASREYSVRNRRAIECYTQAVRLFRLGDTAAMGEQLREALRRAPGFVEVFLLRAQMLEKYDRPDRALDAYRRAFALDSLRFPNGYYHAARMAYLGGQYDTALRYLALYARPWRGKSIDSGRVREFRDRVVYAKGLREAPIPVEPVRLGDSVNSAHDEYFPILSVDGARLSFTRLLPNLPPSPTHRLLPLQEDLYHCARSPAGWSRAEPYENPVNSSQNEGAQSISGLGDEMFFTRCVGPCRIFRTQRAEGGGWTAPVPLPAPVNIDGVSVKQPSLSLDGRYLYFASDRPGGQGGYDIWRSERLPGGGWAEPENLGKAINTPADEQTPFIHFNGRTLYFSSEGHPGLGRLDLFKSELLDSGGWSEPINLGYPINTEHVEMGLSVSPRGDEAFMASGRGGRGLDIYRYPLVGAQRPDSARYLHLQIYDAFTHRPLGGHYELVSLPAGVAVGSGRANAQGEGFVSLPHAGSFALFCDHESYLAHSEHFSPSSSAGDEGVRGVGSSGDSLITWLRVGLQPVEANGVTALRNLFFDSGETTLRPESRVELERWAGLLRGHPSWVVRIEGHTDSVGGEAYNLSLSRRRAQAVRAFLMACGVEASRLRCEGYGASRPVDSNATARGRARNRRTEFRLVSL